MAQTNNSVITITLASGSTMDLVATEIQRCWPTKKNKAWIKLKNDDTMETNEDYTAFVNKWKAAL